MRRKMIAGAIVAIALIFIVIYALTHSSSPKPVAPSPNKPGGGTQSGQQAPQNKPTTSAPAPSTSGSGVSTGGALTDTGPGEVMVVFIAAAITGYFISLRRRLRINS